jgi:hypothetical protein
LSASEKSYLNAMAGKDDAPSNAAIDAFTDPAAVERRVWREIFAVIIIGIIVAAIFAEWRFLLGLMLGSALAVFNFRWLQATLRDILASGARKAPPGAAIQFVIRYGVLAVVGYGAYLTGYFAPAGMLTGLLAPAPAVIIEAAYVTYKTLVHHGER